MSPTEKERLTQLREVKVLGNEGVRKDVKAESPVPGKGKVVARKAKI